MAGDAPSAIDSHEGTTADNGILDSMSTIWSNLFGDKQGDAFEQLIGVQCRDGEVEEQAVEYWARNQFELFNEQNGQADEHVRHYRRHSGLTHAYYPTAS